LKPTSTGIGSKGSKTRPNCHPSYGLVIVFASHCHRGCLLGKWEMSHSKPHNRLGKNFALCGSIHKDYDAVQTESN